MEYFQEDDEFEQIVRSVTSKLKSEQTNLVSHPLQSSPCLLNTKAKILQQLKKCAANVPQSPSSIPRLISFNAGSEYSSHAHSYAATQSSQNGASGDDSSSDMSCMKSSETVSVKDILAKFDHEKRSVNDIVNSWKVVDPRDFMKAGKDDESLNSDLEEENTDPRKETLVDAHSRNHLSTCGIRQPCNPLSSNWINQQSFRTQYDLRISQTHNLASDVDQALVTHDRLKQNYKKATSIASDVSSDITENEDVRENSDDGSTADLKQNEGDTEEDLSLPSDKENVTYIDKWTVVLRYGGLVVEGHKLHDPPDELWHSSKIVKRVSSHLLQTSSGSLYKLVGKMDEEAMETDAKSRHLALIFKNGFPANWQDFTNSHTKVTKTEPKRQRKLKKRRTAQKSLSSSDDPSQGVTEEMNKTKVKKPEKPKKKKASNKILKLSHCNLLLNISGVSEAGTEDDPLVVDKLPKTRSGRLVIPPLSYWTGQRVWIDPETKRVDVIAGSQNVLPEPSLSFRENSDVKSTQRLAQERSRRKKLRNLKKSQKSGASHSKNIQKQKCANRDKNVDNGKSVRSSWKNICENVEKMENGLPCRDNKKNSDVKQITGRAGTLKRKRQLRELIENEKKVTVDDIFENMPTTNKKEMKIPDMTNALKEFRTPKQSEMSESSDFDCLQTPFQRMKLPNPVSEKKTPSFKYVSPTTLTGSDRNKLDRYVHRLKKDLNGRQWGILPKKHVPVKSQSPIHKRNVVTKPLAPSLLMPEADQEMIDDDENSDYYFSD